MIKTVSILALIFMSFFAEAQVIPAERRVNWMQLQSNFNFTVPSEEINILDFGAVNDGLTDNTEVLESALTQTSGIATIIYFPPGEYLFNAPIQLPDSILLRGAGPELTTLLFDFKSQNLSCINITGSASNTGVQVDGGYTKGSNKIYLDSSFIFSGGQMIEITEENGSWDVVPASWAENSVGQMTLIDSVVGDTLVLNSPLRITYDSVLHPSVRAVNPAENIGVECLKIKRVDEPVNGGGYNINISYAKDCRIAGIESDTSNGSHIYIAKSLTVRVTGSYFHHAFQYDGASTHGYGVTLNHHSSECVIENNIFYHLRHAMMVKTGANGNVFGYNYSTDPYRSEPIHDFSGDISLHGHYAYTNLFEGNITQNIIIDHYWGPSGPFNTIFRNRAELWGIIMTTNDLYETSGQNFVGNETTDNATLYGQFILTGTDHFSYGNNILNTIIPAGTDTLPDSSYYLSGKPDFWNISDNWPSIGLPNNLNSGTIPAKQRYLEGTDLTVCPDSVLTNIPESKPNRFSIKIWPNPNKGTFFISAENATQNDYLVTVFNSMGSKVFKTNIKLPKDQPKIVTTNLTPGIYFIVIKSKEEQHTTKAIILE